MMAMFLLDYSFLKSYLEYSSFRNRVFLGYDPPFSISNECKRAFLVECLCLYCLSS
jgi:hypothetical protein